MPTYTEVLPATKSSPNAAIKWTPTGSSKGLLTISQNRSHAEYAVAEFDADGGRAFHFAKIAGGTDKTESTYDVFVANAGSGEHHSCSCRGALRTGNCKHQEAVRAILENGWADTTEQPAPTNATPAPDTTLALRTLLFGKPDPAAKPVLTARDREMGDQQRW